MLAAPSGITAHDIVGTPDALKLRSCMTLFAAVATEETVFTDVLEQFFDGELDPLTLRLPA